MPRDISQPLRDSLYQKNVELPRVWLLEVSIPGGSRYRFSDQKEIVHFGAYSEDIGGGIVAGDPIPYYPAGFAFTQWDETADLSLPRMDVSIADPSLRLRVNLEAYDGFVDRPAVLINAAITGGDPDPASAMRFEGKIVEPNVSAGGVSFGITAADIFQKPFPSQRILAHTCRARKFGSGLCPYPIDDSGATFTTCGRTLGDCEARGADMDTIDAAQDQGLFGLLPKRFGGFKGVGQ